MSIQVKAQLASIRREASRLETQRMREHVKLKRGKLRASEVAEREWTKARKAERRARLKVLRQSIAAIAGKSASVRSAKLHVIHEKRKQFAAWWASVRAERVRRLAEISKLRQELRDWAKLGPVRRKESVQQITEAAQRELAKFDDETREGLDALERAVIKARAELKSDEYDLRTWGANRKRESKPVRPIKQARRENASELAGNVELNLETGEELAWWRRNRPSILRLAKEMGITAGDGIAELVREQVDADPERALEFLQADADVWVEAELRKQGFAA